ncbi:hypothetical protein GCM10022407_01250 [Hymenobacter antarcticus]|uniref:DUF6311 domain-containing protein n=2 Tax=Hymenobacter antarcticus TaxID=486270 RepID=A0ABP7P0F5_9BACT
MPRLAGWGALLAVAFSYSAVFLAWTWPLGTQLATAFPAVADHDGYMQIWSVWHFREMLLSGHNPFYSDWLLYPEGASLLMTTYTPIIGLLNVLVGNEMLALNLMLLGQYTLSGVGAWLLVRRWVRQPLLQWLAGFVFAFSPYKMLRLPEHYDLVLTATVPFFVLAFLRAFEFRAGRLWPLVRSWGAVAACLGLGLLTLFSDYYITFALLYFSLGYALWFWLRLGEINWRQWRSWLVLAGILLVSHIALRLLRLAGVPDNGGFWWGGDVVSYFMPPPNSYWLDVAWAQRLFINAGVYTMPGSIENIMFLGFALPLLGLAVCCWPGKQVSTRQQDPQGRPLAWVLLFSVMLTLPALRIFGKSLVNLPTGFLHLIPFFNNIRCPTRWVLLVSLLLPLVVFAALEARWTHWQPRWQWVLSAVLLVAVSGEYWPVAPPLASSAALPPAFRAVAALPGKALLTIPVGLVDGKKQVGKVELVNFLYQPHYRKKLLSAYLSRIPDARFEAFERGDSVLRMLLRLQQAPADTTVRPPSVAAARAFRQHFQPAAVLISPDWRGGAAHRYIRAAFPDFTEEHFADGYVLLRPNGPPASSP